MGATLTGSKGNLGAKSTGWKGKWCGKKPGGPVLQTGARQRHRDGWGSEVTAGEFDIRQSSPQDTAKAVALAAGEGAQRGSRRKETGGQREEGSLVDGKKAHPWSTGRRVRSVGVGKKGASVGIGKKGAPVGMGRRVHRWASGRRVRRWESKGPPAEQGKKS